MVGPVLPMFLSASGVPGPSTIPPRKAGWELTCTVCGCDTSLKGAAGGSSPSPGPVAAVAVGGVGRARRGLALRLTLSCVRGSPGATSALEEEEGRRVWGWRGDARLLGDVQVQCRQRAVPGGHVQGTFCFHWEDAAV